MILQSSQGRRFIKLFFGLIDHIAPKLDLPSTPRWPCDKLSDYEIHDVITYLWGEPGHRELIDDFVARNPLRFNRTDLRQIEAWKHGLFGNFAVVRDGRDSVFLYGGHAFVVRGVDEEAEDQARMPLPLACSTVLLPFDVLITFGACIFKSGMTSGLPDQASLLEQVRVATQAGRRVSTARAFNAAVDAAVLEEREHPTVPFASPLLNRLAQDNQPIPDQHRGALSGLGAQERAVAIENHNKRMQDELTFEKRAMRYDSLRREIDAECLDGALTWTLWQAIDALDEHDLHALAKLAGINAQVAGQSQQALARAFEQVVGTDVDALLYPVVLRGPHPVQDVKSVYDADGLLRISDAGPELQDVPHAYAPVTQLFHRDNSFVCLMPREVHELLGRANWTESFAQAHRIDSAVWYVEVAVELQGVVRKDEVLLRALDYAQGVTPKELEDAVAERWRMLTIAFQSIDYAGETYLVDDAIVFEEFLLSMAQNIHGNESVSQFAQKALDRLEDHTFAKDLRLDTVQEILDGQQGKPPCAPSEEQLELGVMEATLRTPEAEAFLAYFDENVPDGSDDYRFADEALVSIVNACRISGDIEVAYSRLKDLGFVPTREQVDQMTGLFGDFLAVIPQWTHNGWTARDVPLPKGSPHLMEVREMDITIRE